MLKRFEKAWWFNLLLIGVLLRLALMPATLHPDLWGHSSAAYFFAYQGKLNIYQTLLSLPQDHPLVKNIGVGDVFIYPPLTYFSLGIFRLLAKPFSDPNFIPWMWSNLASIHSYPNLFWHLFLFKFPYIFVDIAAAFILAGLFDDIKKKKLAFLLWIFNPATLYATFMIGQIDILPTFFALLSLYLAKKGKKEWAMVSLGVGGSYKMFPLLLIIPAALILDNNFVKRIKYMIIGFAPFILISLPFLSSVAYRQMVLFSPKSQKMLFMVWNVSGAEGVYPFIFILSIIYFYAYYFGQRIRLGIAFLSILLLIFSVTHYHPQWFLWVTPFLIWELIQSNFKYWPAVAIFVLSWVVITLFFEPSLSFGLFNPIAPNLENAVGLTEVLGKYTNVFQFKSLIRSVFAGTSLFYALSLLFRPVSKRA